MSFRFHFLYIRLNIGFWLVNFSLFDDKKIIGELKDGY